MNETILIIEDEPKITKLARDYLAQSNYRTLIAADGNTGLAMARREHPDLIVLDLMLPGMDGLDVCRVLQGIGRANANGELPPDAPTRSSVYLLLTPRR